MQPLQSRSRLRFPTNSSLPVRLFLHRFSELQSEPERAETVTSVVRSTTQDEERAMRRREARPGGTGNRRGISGGVSLFLFLVGVAATLAELVEAVRNK